MMNKSINSVATTTADSLKKFKNRLGSTALATTLVATSFFGITGTANAINLGGNDVWGDAISTATGSFADPSSGMAVDLLQHHLTINVAGSAVAAGAITSGTGNDANSDVFVVQNTTAAMSWTVASLAASVADFNITNKGDAVGAVTVTVTGTTALTESSALLSQNTTTDVALTVNYGGAVTLASGKDLNVTAAAGSGGGSSAIANIKGAGTNALQDVNLNDDTGLAFLRAAGSAAQVISGTIDGATANEGTIQNSNTSSGSVTFSGVVGTTVIKNIITDSSATSIFSGADVASTLMTNAGTTSFTGADTTYVTTLANTGTLTVKSADFQNATGNGAITVTNTGTLNLLGEATVAVTGTIIAGAGQDGNGVINIYDGSGGAAIITSISGLIGSADDSLATLAIGGIDSANTDAGRAAFAANVFVDTVTITSGQDGSELSQASFADNLTSTSVTLTSATGGDATAIFAAGSGATTIVTGTIDGAGDVLVEGGGTSTSTFNGNLGSGTTLKEFHVGDADIADINANLKATNITFDNAASELEITGTGTQTVTGLLDGDTTGGIGILQISNTAIIESNIGATQELGDIIIGDGKTATFGGVIKTEDFLLGSTGTGGSNVLLQQDGHVIGDRTQGDTGILTFGKDLTLTLDDTIVAGETIFDVDFTDSATATNGVVVTAGTTVVLPSNFNTGAITLIDGDVALAVTVAELALLSASQTALTSYEFTHTDSNKDVTLTASAQSETATAVALGVTNNSARAFKQASLAILSTGVAAEVDALTGTLNATGGFSATEDTALAKQVAPQTDTIGGSSVATRAMTGTVQGIVSNRMASLRSGDAFVTGVSAGNGMSANSGFIQAFGSEGEQKNTSSSGATVFGFDSETSGVAIGFDGMTDSGSTIGLSASYSTSDVDGKGTGKSKNSIDSYTVSVYADKATENGYIEGSLTYGINDNTASRLVNSAGLSRSYSANYDSNQISLKVGGGVPQEVRDSMFVTPFMNATATTINTDAFTEKSNVSGDALRLRVEQDDTTSLIGTVGVKAHMVTDKGTPMISLAVNNEFGDSEVSSQNTYQGGGTKFKTTTEVEELSATLGLGYSFGNDVTSLNLNYEANVNDDEYINQYGSVKIVAKF